MNGSLKTKFPFSFQKSTKNEELCKLLQTMEDLKCSPSGNGQDIADNISPWFEDLLKQYESVVGIKELQVLHTGKHSSR